MSYTTYLYLCTFSSFLPMFMHLIARLSQQKNAVPHFFTGQRFIQLKQFTEYCRKIIDIREYHDKCLEYPTELIEEINS